LPNNINASNDKIKELINAALTRAEYRINKIRERQKMGVEQDDDSMTLLKLNKAVSSLCDAHHKINSI
jgi:hypothetical protein